MRVRIHPLRPIAHEQTLAPALLSVATAKSVIRLLRPHQWSKNLLVAVPLLLAHRMAEEPRLIAVLAAFVAFSLCASSVYVLNDALDVSADRAHARKCKRPFASGELALAWAGVLVPSLLASSFGLAFWFVGARFALVLAVYFVMTLLYSTVLKRVMMLDVIVLAGLYTLRLVAGAVAADVEMSYWLSGFSLFLFLDLALLKRYTELASVEQAAGSIRGRGYHTPDLPHLAGLGASAGYVAVLVLALYLHSLDVERLYTRPEVLWGILPLMLYWLSRLWLIVARGEMHDDPIVFAITDPPSWVVLAGCGLIFLSAV